jgi:putative FmdB family regulatory protein
MLKRFSFECEACGHEFDELVEGVEGKPERCFSCGSSKGFKKLPSVFSNPSTIVVDYPGSKRFKAGYVHTHGDRPAEKKGSQISMAGSKGKNDG